MAYKRKRKASNGEDAPREKSKSEELLLRGRECYTLAQEADETNRTEALADIRFVNVPGAQWDTNMRKRRGKRPCYEFNKLRINGKRVINEIRANRPQGKVRATEGGDKKGADLREGICRNIWAQSDGDTIVDNAAEYQVDGGMACWRVTTEYASEDVFDQDIKIEGFKNPFCVYVDPSCKDPLKRDARYWFVEDKIANSVYEERWPDAEKIEFESLGEEHGDDWEEGETVRVCEYWYKEPYDKRVVQVRTPKGVLVVDTTSDEWPSTEAKIKAGEYQQLRERMVKCDRIMMCIMSGDAVLEGPVEWAGSMFPFVMVYGEHKVIDGKFKWWGLHRFAKDAQQSYNLNRTSSDESVHQAAKSKFWASPTMAKGNAEQWSQAHDENLPALISNPDPNFPGRFPERMGGADVPVAMMELSSQAAQDIRDVTGLHEASFGEESNETSGVAIARKQNQAQIVTYNFPDNMAKGIRRTWEIMLDLIPEIYDAEREMRILGADGAEDYVKINELVTGPPDENGMPTTVRVNDMTSGKYDVAITVGPNFSTQRQEAAEIYGELGNKNPALMQVAGDLVFKSMDLPYADQIAQRWQSILPPPIQKQLAEGKDLPPEAQAAMAQAEQAMGLVQQQGQLVQQAAGEVQQEKAQADKAKAEVNTAIANLKTEQARFDAHMEQREAALVKQEANLVLKEARSTQGQAQQDAQNDRQSLVAEVREAIAALTQMSAQERQQSMQMLTEALARFQPQVILPPARKVKSIRRVVGGNGETSYEPQYDEQVLQ